MTLGAAFNFFSTPNKLISSFRLVSFAIKAIPLREVMENDYICLVGIKDHKSIIRRIIVGSYMQELSEKEPQMIVTAYLCCCALVFELVDG